MISITYRIAQVLSFLYLKIFHRLEIEGLDNVPKEGAFILASNHAFIDPPALGCRVTVICTTLQKIHFLLMLGYLIRKLNSIPVNRGQLDLKTLRSTISVLKRKSSVCFSRRCKKSKWSVRNCEKRNWTWFQRLSAIFYQFFYVVPRKYLVRVYSRG